MPRLPNSLIRKAHAINPLLPPLLGPCRELGAAQNELRWLREHVDGFVKARLQRTSSPTEGRDVSESRNSRHMMDRNPGDALWLRSPVQERVRENECARIPSRTRLAQRQRLTKDELLKSLVVRRAKGYPLQYLLGTEYFGDLEIECRPGVLIPRPETAASVTHLVGLLKGGRDLPDELRLLDLCTGTGCIPLLFCHEFLSAHSNIELRLLGVDISRRAIALANHNLRRLGYCAKHAKKASIEFMIADVLVSPFADQTYSSHTAILPLKSALNCYKHPVFWDVVISNPPYISPSAFRTTTARSVRGFEPRLAFVPPQRAERTDTEQGDAFYPMILRAARDAEAKIVLLEVADLDQALRVARMAQALQFFDGIEIWRDQPDQHDHSSSEIKDSFPIVGQGNGRSVLCWQGRGNAWLGKPKEKATEGGSLNGISFSLQPTFQR